MEDINLPTSVTTPKAQMPSYRIGPRHKRPPRSRRFMILMIKVLAYFLVALTFIAAIVVGAISYNNYRTNTAHISHTLSNPPPVIPIFSTGPNDTVALGCFGRDVERKGKDPYMPGLFYQYSNTFSRADGLYAAGLFCDDVVKEDIAMGILKDGAVEMVEMTYETLFGSKKVALRAQWDVLGENDHNCRNGTRKLEFGADPDVHARCIQYLSQPIEYCGEVATNQQSLITAKNKFGGSFFKGCIFWSVYLAPPGRGPTKEDAFF